MKITNETKSTQLKQFNLNPNVNGGISKGMLIDVTVDDIEINNESPLTTFRGYFIPRLSFKFQSYGDNPNVKPSFYFHSFLAVEHTAKNLLKANVWRQDVIAQTFKHFHETFSNRDLTKEEIKLLDLGLEEKDENNSFIPQTPEVVIAAWTKFFNNIVTIFNGLGKNGTPIYKDESGNPLPIWMKLLIYGNKGFELAKGSPAMPTFIGQGVIERLYPNIATSLKVEIGKGESVVPVKKDFAKPVISAAVSGGQAIADDDIPDYMRQPNNDVPY